MTISSEDQPESEYLCLLNSLKSNLNPRFLTSSQTDALKEIEGHITNQERRVNLYGQSNAGKTYLSWVLATKNGWVYYSTLEHYFSSNRDLKDEIVILDHGEPSRDVTRRIRTSMKLRNIKNIIYNTVSPAEEFYPRVRLESTERDGDKIIENWTDLGFNRYAGIDSIDVWQKVLRGIMKR